MKRIIIFSLVLCMLLLCFVSCGNSKRRQDKEPVKEPDTNVEQEESVSKKDQELISTLVDYLKKNPIIFDSSVADSIITTDIVITEEPMNDLPGLNYYIGDTILSEKLDKLKDSTQPLLVGFDPSDYYYMCAYFDVPDGHFETLLCCVEQYTWVKFDAPGQIHDTYDGKTFIAAFQINKASLVTDLYNADADIPEIEHFQRYTTRFVEGKNSMPALRINDIFVYTNKTKKEYEFYTQILLNDEWSPLRCIEYNGELHVMTMMRTVYSYGDVFDVDLDEEFGEYRGSLMQVMLSSMYSVMDAYGNIAYYGLIPIDDFVDVARNHMNGVEG